MKSKNVVTSYGTFEFDSEGVSEMTDEQAERLSKLRGYKILDNAEGTSSEDDKEDSEGKSSDNEENDQIEDEIHEEESSEDDDQDLEDADPDTSDNEDEETEEQFTEEKLDKLTVAQLKKIAKDAEVDLNGATKKDEIICILLGSQN